MADSRLYVGAGRRGPLWARPEQAVLVLGPPRSGKTSAIVIPTVMAADGPVVSTSTKPDVLEVTAPARRARGDCLLYDPSGTVSAPAGVERLRWSPVSGCTRWDDAMLVARALVGATRSSAWRADPAGTGDHWSERAEALLGPLLHAAAVGGEPMGRVLSWVDRRQAGPALRILEEGHGASARASDLLAGIAATDEREQSGIWSTASGVLAAYRSEAALESTTHPRFDAAAFCSSPSTLYICATGRHQALAAPLVVGLLTEVRAAAYARAAELAAAGQERKSLVLALDEVANIAPIPDLPAMVSEGGGQGVLTLACLQDLSQARARWGTAADGLLSLFGTTVVLPGIGDGRTLEALSTLAGEHQVAAMSVSRGDRRGLGPLSALGAVMGPARLAGRWAPWSRTDPVTTTVSTRTERRLPVDALARGEAGQAVVVDERNRMSTVTLTPWFATAPWRDLGRKTVLGREGPVPERGPELGR